MEYYFNTIIIGLRLFETEFSRASGGNNITREIVMPTQLEKDRVLSPLTFSCKAVYKLNI